jgi:hypothetical protein
MNAEPKNDLLDPRADGRDDNAARSKKAYEPPAIHDVGPIKPVTLGTKGTGPGPGQGC